MIICQNFQAALLNSEAKAGQSAQLREGGNHSHGADWKAGVQVDFLTSRL